MSSAYTNRGLAKVLINDKTGCADLGIAGENGLDKAYEYIRKYCN